MEKISFYKGILFDVIEYIKIGVPLEVIEEYMEKIFQKHKLVGKMIESCWVYDIKTDVTDDTKLIKLGNTIKKEFDLLLLKEVKKYN